MSRCAEDDEEDAGAEQALDRLVLLASEWSDHASITPSCLAALCDQVDLDGEERGQSLEALRERGLDVRPRPKAESGPTGYSRFLRRARHRLLSFDQEQAIGARLVRGRESAHALARRTDMDQTTQAWLRRQVRDGDAAAAELMHHNVRLVVHVAKRFVPRAGSGMDLDDLVQEGWFGLVRAVERWEPGRKLKFSTYATWWIRQVISRAIDDQSRAVRLPVHVAEVVRSIETAQWRLERSGLASDAAAVATALHLSEQRVTQLLRWSAVPTPAECADLARLENRDVAQNGATDGLDEWEIRDRLWEAMERLSDREQEVIDLRFGLTDDDRYTLEAIGDMYGVTRERIRQIEAKAMGKLKTRELRMLLEPCDA